MLFSRGGGPPTGWLDKPLAVSHVLVSFSDTIYLVYASMHCRDVRCVVYRIHAYSSAISKVIWFLHPSFVDVYQSAGVAIRTYLVVASKLRGRRSANQRYYTHFSGSCTRTYLKWTRLHARYNNKHAFSCKLPPGFYLGLCSDIFTYRE